MNPADDRSKNVINFSNWFSQKIYKFNVGRYTQILK